MVWCEVSAAASVEQAELVAEAMRGVAPGGVSIEDPLVPLGPEEGVRLDRRRPSVVRAYLPVDDSLGEWLRRLDELFESFGLRPELTTRTVHEQDWADAWKEHFHVERIGQRIIIRPSWREYQPGPGDVVIDLDPGMAFGTGQHPTTRMCLELLEREVQPGALVLDVGTGSGILAVAAIKLGAARCLAFDLEPQAVKVARENCARNGVAEVVEVREGTLDLTPPPPSLKGRGSYDRRTSSTLGSPLPLGRGSGGRSAKARPREGVVAAHLIVANITAGAVAELAPAFALALRPGGRVIGSGIVADRLPLVLDALSGVGLQVDEVRADGDWRTVVAASVEPPTPMPADQTGGRVMPSDNAGGW